MHHIGVALLALLQPPSQNVLVAGEEIILAQNLIPAIPILGHVQPQDDSRRQVVVFVDERRPVGAGAEVAIAEGAEGGELGAIVGLAAVAAHGGGDKAKAKVFFAEAVHDGVIVAQVEGALGVAAAPRRLQGHAEVLAGG